MPDDFDWLGSNTGLLGTETPTDLPGATPSPSNGSRFSVAGMGFSILGGLLKGMAAIQAGNFNAQIDRQNAAIAERAAGDAMVRGQSAAAYSMLRTAHLVGQQKSAYASAGAAVDSGSAADVASGTALTGRLDADTITNNAARAAWGYETNAAVLKQKAAIDEALGRQQLGSDILGGITGAASYGAPRVGLV